MANQEPSPLIGAAPHQHIPGMCRIAKVQQCIFASVDESTRGKSLQLHGVANSYRNSCSSSCWAGEVKRELAKAMGRRVDEGVGESRGKKNDFNFETNLHLNGRTCSFRGQIYLSNHEMWTQLGSSINIIWDFCSRTTWRRRDEPTLFSSIGSSLVLIMIFKLMEATSRRLILSVKW